MSVKYLIDCFLYYDKGTLSTGCGNPFSSIVNKKEIVIIIEFRDLAFFIGSEFL